MTSVEVRAPAATEDDCCFTAAGGFEDEGRGAIHRRAVKLGAMLLIYDYGRATSPEAGEGVNATRRLSPSYMNVLPHSAPDG